MGARSGDYNVLAIIPYHLHLEILAYVPLRTLLTYARCCWLCKRVAEDDKLCGGKFLQVATNALSPPLPRLCASAVILNGSLNLYGGDSGQPEQNYIDGVKNEIWTFSFGDKKWTEHTQVSGTRPVLTEQSSVLYDNDICIFGGNSGNTLVPNQCGSTLYKYRLDKGIIAEVCCNNSPSPRSAHSAVVYGDKMYVFGGWNGIQSLADFHVLDLKKCKTWELVPATGDLPCARRAHGTVVHSHYMYLFGGFDGRHPASYFNMMHRFDFETNKWEILTCTGDIPRGRSRLGMVCYYDRIYILGGWDRKDYFSDFYEFSTKTFQWRALRSNIRECIGGIGQHVCVVYKQWLVVFGGFSAKERTSTNKMFATRLRTVPPPSLSCSSSI